MTKPESGLKVAAGALAIGALAGLQWCSGGASWSPINLLLGPQAEGGRSDAVQGTEVTRESFQKQVVPKLLPRLTSFLTDRGATRISYDAADGRPTSVIASISGENGLMLETEIYVGTKSDVDSRSTRPIPVKMFDRNLDGKLDSIEFADPIKSVKAPDRFDPGATLMWDVALAVALRGSGCCNGER